jgi:hypothetical protein
VTPVHGTCEWPPEWRKVVESLDDSMFIARKPWEPEPEIHFSAYADNVWEGLQEALQEATTEAAHRLQDIHMSDLLAAVAPDEPDPYGVVTTRVSTAWTVQPEDAEDGRKLWDRIAQLYESVRDQPYELSMSDVRLGRQLHETVFVVEKSGTPLGYELLADQPGLAPWIKQAQRGAIQRFTGFTYGERAR